MARLIFSLMTALAFTASPRAVRADDPPKQEELPRRQATFTWEKQEKGGPDLLLASYSFTDVVDGEVRKKLSSGLPTVIAMRAYLLREGEANPIALAVRTCRVSYDLWEEVYVIKMSGPGGDRNAGALNVEGVFRQCFQAVKLPIADRSLVAAGKPHFLGVIVEVNPVSPQMIDQMRKWVTRPAGSTGIGPGDALFGSFVGLFVREIGKADRTLRFRTQSLTP
ncbi:MAG: hypothetical protein KF819_12575 [Labilithrix sp.]|nr:hypothetical protein [Labilithrix sp.]